MENHEEESVNEEIDVNPVDRQDVTRYLSKEISVFLSNLDNIWEEIGTDLNERKRTGLIVIENVKDLLGKMFEEAETQKNSLLEKITNQMEEISSLSKALHINITDDFGSYDSMPLNTVSAILQEKIKKYQDIHEALLQEVNKLKERDQLLCPMLGRKEKFLPTSPIPSSDVINSFKNHLDEMAKEILKRQEFFLKAKSEIIDIMKELDIRASLEFEKKVIKNNETDFILSDENMEQLEILNASLHRQQKDLISKVTDLREKITIYWERLEESLETRTAFLKNNSGNSKKVYQALKAEELRCKNKVKANIKIFIDKIRLEIEKWWEDCLYSDEQRKEFLHYDSDCYNEDLLSLHEMYIEKLKNYFETNKGIFDLISKRTQLWTRLLELEKNAVNPDRFKNRGGQLLREEKERNSVQVQLPKVEDKLVKMVAEYELKHKKPFLILGQIVTDIIENDWTKFRDNKYQQLSAKKQTRENVLKTPMKSPGSTKILAALSTCKTPRTPNTPAKRRLAMPLFGSSSAKKNKSLIKKTPKVTVNASTLNKRVSLERRKRLQRKRHSTSKKSTTTDYDSFEMGLDNKTTCRSTLHIGQGSKENIAGPSCIPEITVQTPSRSNLKSKSPSNRNNRMTPVPGTGSIII